MRKAERVDFGLLRAVRDLAAETVFAKFGADHLDDVIGVAVGFCKNQGFRQFLATGEDGLPLVTEGLDHGADLVGGHDGAVKLGRGIGGLVFLRFPTARAGLAFAFLNQLLGLQFAARLADFGLNEEDLVADVDLVGDGVFVGVFVTTFCWKNP